MKIAIDFGSAVTKIYRIGNGIVLAEPTCIAVNAETKKIKAIGAEAKNLFCKSADGTQIIFPVSRGEIVDERSAVILLKRFLSKTEIKSSRLGNVQALFSVPCGLSSAGVAAYYRVATQCGFSGFSFVEALFLSAIGVGAPISDTNPVFTIDVGAELTQIALSSYDGIIAGASVGYAGVDIDEGIMKSVKRDTGITLGAVSGEELKNEVASLMDGDAMNKIVRGMRGNSGQIASLDIYSVNILEPVWNGVEKILKYVDLIMKKIPPEVYRNMYSDGIYLTGGVSMLPGLAEYITQKFGIRAISNEKSSVAVILGGGHVADDNSLLKKLRLFV